MSAPKHTPGPWVAVGRFVEVADDNVPDICTTDPAAIGQQNLPRSYAECCANARLIAAAPELLEALKELVAAVDAIGERPSGELTPRALLEALFDAALGARMAIDNATRSAS
jgi:hypothetical protein